MVNTYSASNYGIPIGRVADYNNTRPSREITSFRAMAQTTNPISVERKNYSDFASAVYGDSPYSLDHPNQKSEMLALNIDYVA